MKSNNYNTIISVANIVFWLVVVLLALGMLQAAGGDVKQDMVDIFNATLDVGAQFWELIT